MSTRFYFQYNQSAPVTASVVGTWTSTSGMVRCQLATEHQSGDSPTTINSGVGNNTNLCYAQAVSDTLPTGTAFTTSTQVKSYWQMNEDDLSANARSNLAIGVVSSDGSTVRMLMRQATDTNGTELNTSLRNYRVANNDTLTNGYTTVSGDRLVMEMGAAIVAGTSSPQAAIRFGSDGTDLPENQTETGTTFVGWVEISLDVAFPEDATATPGVIARSFALGAVSAEVPSTGPPSFGGSARSPEPGFTIGGRPVNLLDWRFDAVTNQGDRTLTGKLPKDVTWAEQDAPVVAWRGSEDPCWSGFISSDPSDEGDVWNIRAHGRAEAFLEPQTERMFYRRDGGEGWVDQDAEPHEQTTMQGFDTTVGRASLKWAWGNGDDVFANNDHAGFILWLEGTRITRYSVESECIPNISNVDFITRELTGPDGASAIVNTHSLSTNGTRTGNLAQAASDALWFRAQANASATPATRRRFKLTRIRIYGRTTDDDFSISDVVEDVGTHAGLDVSGVQANSQRALPLDWTEDHPGLLSYVAGLAGWRWLVTHSGLEFGPYERTWDVYEDDTEGFSFVPERRYNVVVQPWENLSGIERQRSATATDDPFPGESVVLRVDKLSDPQPDGDLAEEVAQARVNYEASLRVTGSLQVHRVRSRGPRSPYDVRPGDLLRMPELHPLGPQRIEAVTYEPDDRVSVELGSDFNLPRAMARARRRIRRRGR